MRRTSASPALLVTVSLLAGVVLFGCNRSGSSRAFISVGTAPVGGAFYQVGAAVAEVVNQHSDDLNWRVSAEATGGSMENIRLLSQGKLQFAMANASISYFAVRGQGDWHQPHEIRSVMTLFPNVAMFVTTADSGIESVADLKGRRVFLGPEGAGFEYFVEPILEAHGLSIAELQPRYGAQQAAVDMLGDGAVAAAMVGGGIPNPAITQMAQAGSVRFVPYDDQAKQKLFDQYAFFEPATVPGGTYTGIDQEYQGMNVGSAHLITHADADEEMVYAFTKRVYENRGQIAERHAAAKSISEATAARHTGTEFHPGAIRYFQEIGIWADASDDEQ